MKKILNLVMILLVVIPVVLLLLWVFGVFGAFNQKADVFGGADIMLALAAVYLGVGLLVLVGMTLANMGKGRGDSKLGLYVFGGLAIVGVILYFVAASSTSVIGADGTVFDDMFTLKITDTMLYLTYIALGVTVVALLGGVVRQALK
jgi:hypothetical protein